MTTVRIGLIGAGNMGGGMLRRLRHLGQAVAVCDVDPQRQGQAAALGACLCDSAAQVAASLSPQGVLLVAVVDAQQTDAVLWGPEGAVAAMRAGQAVMLCPTLSPQVLESQGERLAAAGLLAIDAPMSGGPERAAQGTMSLMVACEDVAWQQASAVIGMLSQNVFRVGQRVGDGARTKLVNNLLAAINLAGTAEALALAERMGLDVARTLAVIEASSGQSWIGSDRMHRALAGDHMPRAHTTLLAKDSQLAVQAAASVGVVPALGSVAQALFAQAVADGLGTQDDAVLWNWMRQAR